MPRADRLYDLIQILRDGQLHRAGDLAFRLGVSDRTIWRDMQTLMASGLPVEGERGVGYLLRAPITLPPILLSMAELEALRHGLAHVAQGPDPALARGARSLAGKVASIVPASAIPADDDLFVFTGEAAARPVPHLPVLHAAIRARRRLVLTCAETGGEEVRLSLRPLGLETRGGYRVLVAWCEAPRGFREIRLDRLLAITETAETFPRDRGRELADWRRGA